MLCLLFCMFQNLKTAGKGLEYPGIQLDHVVITGTSNVSDFKFLYVNEDQNQQWLDPYTSGSSLLFSIPVDDITASNRLMVSDFKALIHADFHPHIHIEVDQKQIIAMLNGEEFKDIKVKVTLAGIAKIYTIPLFSGLVPGRNRYIMGRTSLLLSDFQLEPRSKIFRLIKIGNEVFINFRINFHPLEITQIDSF